MRTTVILKRLRALATPRWDLRLAGVLGWIFLAGLLTVAGMVRFQLPAVAVSEWDSWGWLHPALNWLGGLGFREEYEREWLYGAFIAFCLRLTGSFAGYVVIQQILGLIAAVIMWLTWRRWISLFPKSLALETASTGLGLFLITLYLFNPFTIAGELGIRPEAIMAFVSFLQLYCVVSYCNFRWHQPNAAAACVFGAFALVLAWAMYVLKPNWALAVPLTALPVFLGIFGKSESLKARLLPFAIGCVMIVLTLWLPERLLFIRNGKVRVVLPMTLFTIHADIISTDMNRELRSPRTSDTRRRFLERFFPELERELITAVEGKKYYKRLGFDPDYLMYRSTLFPGLVGTHGMTTAEIAAFCRNSFLSAVINQPFAYARKVCSQMGYFVFPDDDTFIRKRIEWGKLYTYVRQTLPESLNLDHHARIRDIYQTYCQQVKTQSAATQKYESDRGFRHFLKAAKQFALPIELLFLISLVVCLVATPLRHFRLPGLIVLLFFAAPAGNALTVALVHALDNSRYRGAYGPLLLFALGAMLLFILCVSFSVLCERIKVGRAKKNNSPA